MKDGARYVISYPKSGRTWLRLLIGRYLVLQTGSEDSLIESLNQLCALAYVPALHLSHAGSDLKSSRLPPVEKLSNRFQDGFYTCLRVKYLECRFPIYNIIGVGN